MHLDAFQRIMVDPASLSIIRYTASRPYVVTANSTNADLAKLLAPPPKKASRRTPPRRTTRRSAAASAPAGTREARADGRSAGQTDRGAAHRLGSWRFSCTATTRPTGSSPAPSGSPGERTFFLQAREGNRITSVACEKQQVSVLAEHLDRVLDEVVRRGAAGSGVRRSAPAARTSTRWTRRSRRSSGSAP